MEQAKKRILIIEDEIFVIELYERVLKREGFDIIKAIDGEEGLKKAKEGIFDLILLDIMLPKKNGIEVLRELKMSKSPVKNFPVVLLTNLGQESVIQEAFRIGAIGYLLKARFVPAEVVEKIKTFFKTGKISTLAP